VLPNYPSPKDHHRVKPFSRLTIKLRAAQFPPSLKRFILLRSKAVETDSTKQLKPELSGENTRNQQVLDCFFLLITKRAMLRMW
jgi:hypothetical protein